MRTLQILVFFLLLLILAACRKQSFITSPDASISLSNDSIHFDTIFTSTGSVTQTFKIFNRNNYKLRVNSIALAGGETSFFQLNADGWPGPEVANIEMNANDSLYVFVTVSVDPSQTNLPFIIEDSILISFNGNQHAVKLSAWGQNARFIDSRIVTKDSTWTNEKPIVIRGGVYVLEGAKLTIEKGTRVYLHADAPILVEGTMEAVGERYDSTKIYFSGDRLDRYYRDLPGSWPGIYFREKSRNNILKYAVLNNAYQGIVVEGPRQNSHPKLSLAECIIDNCYDAGIIAVNSDIVADNCVVSNCGKNMLLVQGGTYQFSHCTNVAVSNAYVPHQQPVLTLSDFIKEGEQFLFGSLEASFVNCIFWGSNGIVEDEVVVLKEGTDDFDAEFINCLWKAETPPSDITSSGIISNTDPMFEVVEPRDNVYNFRLREGSPAINAGINTTLTNDVEGKPRLGQPDIGAYESIF